MAVNSASPRSNAELEQAYLAELNRPEEEELFAELDRDWYENEEKSEGKENNKELEKELLNDTIIIDDIFIGKSVGAKSKNYDVFDFETGEVFNFAEGEKIQNAEVFAGYGTKKSLRPEVAQGLSEAYGGKPEKWQHSKGIGVLDCDGELMRAEVHWFQEESAGKVKFKIKRWLE